MGVNGLRKVAVHLRTVMRQLALSASGFYVGLGDGPQAKASVIGTRGHRGRPAKCHGE
jgi:hypothetical protein